MKRTTRFLMLLARLSFTMTMPAHFTHPRSPRERGSTENTNGLVEVRGAYDEEMRRAGIYAIDLVDVLVYLIVLGTFTQLFPQVISESFLASLTTAVLLKAVLEVVIRVKSRIVARINNADIARVRIVSSVLLVLTAAGSKAFILWLTDVALGDAVYLGGFFAVTLLIVVLMVCRAGVRALVK